MLHGAAQALRSGPALPRACLAIDTPTSRPAEFALISAFLAFLQGHLLPQSCACAVMGRMRSEVIHRLRAWAATAASSGIASAFLSCILLPNTFYDA